MDTGTAHSAVILEVDDNRCLVCPRCRAKEVCRGNAIRTIDRDEAPFIDTSRCWGCLVCIPQCPVEAIVRHTVIQVCFMVPHGDNISRLVQLRRERDELVGNLPRHSLPASMLIRIEELEEEIETLQTELDRVASGGASASVPSPNKRKRGG